MKNLREHNKEMMEKYGLEGRKWKLGDVTCPVCDSGEPMLEQVGVVHTTHPPKVRVKCPECKVESYKIV